MDRLNELYNLKRSRQGYRLRVRTPVQALREAFGVEQLRIFTEEVNSESCGVMWPVTRVSENYTCTNRAHTPPSSRIAYAVQAW